MQQSICSQKERDWLTSEQEAASQMSAYRVIGWVVMSIILSACLAVAGFWVYAIVTGGKNF